MQPDRPPLRVVTGFCEWGECSASARWNIRRGQRGFGLLVCGRHLHAACTEISDGRRWLAVTPVRQEELSASDL